MMGDVTLTCRNCGQAFSFTSGEQDYYASRGFSEPSRCRDCRAANKTRRDDESSSYGSGPGSREMFGATCSSCGQQAQVPFQPSRDKPVYCSACFETQRAANRTGGSRYRTQSRY